MVMALATYGSVLAATKPFERVEAFPAGEQGSGKGLITPKSVTTETVTLDRPYAVVWSAVKVVARQFDKIGKRPLVGIDEEGGRVQNGKINLDAIIGGNDCDWKDEFVTEVTKVTAQSTRLSVSRKLVRKGCGWVSSGSGWQSYNSNGMIERWMITQVLDQVNKPSPKPTEFITDATTVRYVYKEDDKNYLDLNADGAFRLVQQGKQYRGNYTLTAEEITLILGKQTLRSRLAGDSMWDTSGKEWVKRASGETTEPSVAFASSKARDTSFTNADVIKLVEAKLPESVIISKIKSSSCNFDVSTDALIKLKSATASDAVVQAVVECKPQ